MIMLWNKIKYFAFSAILLSIFCVYASVMPFASDGRIDDERVTMIYWDNYDWGVIYTGVTNKIGYNAYAPCFGKEFSGYSCGAFALKGEYKEYGLSLTGLPAHKHALQNRDLGMDYIVD